MKVIPRGEYAYTTEIHQIIYENGAARIVARNDAVEVPYSTEAEFNKVFGKEKKFINGVLSDIPYSEKMERARYSLRKKRERDCFPIINRGKLWYDKLSDAQKSELDSWYTAWLNVTVTMSEPAKPAWLK